MALTPRGVALANLIDLYATSDMNLETRHQLCILLVEQVNQSAAASVIEPGLQTLRTALAPLPASLRDEFDKRLLETTEPDDLWDLMGSLNELLQPTLSLDDGMGPIQLERSSVRRPPATRPPCTASCRRPPCECLTPSLLSLLSDARPVRSSAAPRLPLDVV